MQPYNYTMELHATTVHHFLSKGTDIYQTINYQGISTGCLNIRLCIFFTKKSMFLAL